MLPAIEEVVKWYSLPSVPSHLSSTHAILREARLPEPALSQPTHSGKVASGQPSAALARPPPFALTLAAPGAVGSRDPSRLASGESVASRRSQTADVPPADNSSSKSEKQCRPRPKSARRRPVPFRRIPVGPLGVSGRG